MSVHTKLFFCFLGVSTIFAFFGFYKSGLYYMEIAVAVNTILWILLRKKNPSFCLVVSVILPITGIFLGVHSLFMILFCGFSFGAWDIAHMKIQIQKNSWNVKNGLYNSMRLISLALSLVLSFAVIFTFTLVHINIPFFIMFILVLSAFFCMYRLIQIFDKKRK